MRECHERIMVCGGDLMAQRGNPQISVRLGPEELGKLRAAAAAAGVSLAVYVRRLILAALDGGA